jgi:hypothetical protein
MTTTSLTTTTKHTANCGRVFRNYDMSCPRCRELAEGFGARAGWNDNKRKAEAVRCRQVAEFFAPGGKYSQMSETEKTICTAFEW